MERLSVASKGAPIVPGAGVGSLSHGAGRRVSYEEQGAAQKPRPGVSQQFGPEPSAQNAPGPNAVQSASVSQSPHWITPTYLAQIVSPPLSRLRQRQLGPRGGMPFLAQ
jgi:hypothetical protein